MFWRAVFSDVCFVDRAGCFGEPACLAGAVSFKPARPPLSKCTLCPPPSTAARRRDQGPLDLDAIRAHCREAWGVEPVVDTHVTLDGGLDYRRAGLAFRF
jgi:hypothetical protein